MFFSVSFLNVWARISVRTWPLLTRRPHPCPLRTHRTTHRWPKFRLPHSCCNDGMVFRMVQNVSNECTANPIRWSRKSRKQMLSESCMEAVFCESIHTRYPSGELEARGALFPEIAFRPWSALRHLSRNRDHILSFDMCCANASESLFDKIYDEIMKFWWYSSINKVWLWIYYMIWIWFEYADEYVYVICKFINLCFLWHFFSITLFWSSEVGLNLSHS